MSLRRVLHREDDVVDDDCEDWTAQLTGTFLLTDELLWDTSVPLTLIGPDGGTARLRAVGDGSTAS